MAQAATRTNGTIALTGKWDDETIKLLNTVLCAFQNIHEHAYWNDLRIGGKFSQEAKKLPFTTEGGLGFDFTLQLLNEFMAEQTTAGKELSQKTCHALLTAMEEKKLRLTLDFTLYSNWGYQELDSYLGNLNENEVKELEKLREDDSFDLELYYMLEVLDPECPEIYRSQRKEHLVLSAKNGAWALNKNVFTNYNMSPDCGMEWLIVFHVFVEEGKENKLELTPIQLVRLRSLCLQWAKENELYYTTDYAAECNEIITWDTGDEWPLEIDEILLRYYVWDPGSYQSYDDEDGKKDVEQLVERIRADLQPSVDAILKN